MDAGDYETNTFLINNLASVAYRIYEPVAAPSSTYAFDASAVEEALRSDGHLVYVDAKRHSMWCFYLTKQDPSATAPPEQLGLTAKMEVHGYYLALVEEGGFEPVSLLRSRYPGAHHIHTPSSSSSSGSAFEAPTKGMSSFNPTPSTAQASSGGLLDAKGYSAIPVKEIHEFFISALLSSLTTAFCQQIRAIPLNHRTVLLPPRSLEAEDTEVGQLMHSSALATFRVYLTTTGSLVISLCVSLLRGLISSADALRFGMLPSGPLVLAAPLGAFGVCQGILDSESHIADAVYGQSPDTHLARLRLDPGDKFSQWRTTCSRLLKMRGMLPSLLDDCAWLNIRFSQRRQHEQRLDGRRTPGTIAAPTAPWPSVLCFGRPRTQASLDRRLEGNSSLVGDSADPLNEARSWFTTGLEREDALEKRGKERITAGEPGDSMDTDARNHHIGGYSPMAGPRPNNGAAAAAGIMYPTPPDVIQQPGVTPGGFDGPILSPSNQPQPNAMVGLDNSTGHHPGPAYDEAWAGTEPKREQPTGTFLDGENIYGDLGDNMFEGNDIIEDDFNFFDENPEAGFEMPVLDDLGAAMDATMDMAQSAEPQTIGGKSAVVNRSSGPAEPVFTKPELKHARSTLAEETRQSSNLESYNANTAVGIKRHPSPFNPDTVYKRIRASIRVPPQSRRLDGNGRGRRVSMFERVDFDPSLSLTNQKYQEKGRFNYTIPTRKDNEKDGAVTMPGIPQKPKHLKDLPSNLSTLLSRMSGGPAGSPAVRDDVRSESGDSVFSSDSEEASDVVDEPSSPAKSSVVKRRPDDDVISLAASFKDLEDISTDSPGYGSVDLARLSAPDIPELSLVRYFSEPEPVSLHSFPTDHDLITVAQIITEQAASGSLRLGSDESCPELRDARRCVLNAIRYSMQGLRKALPSTLADATECQLRGLIEVQDVPLLAQPNRVQPRPPGQELIKPPIFQIPSPHLELRRSEAQLSVLPSAISFWESLGLGPTQGSKDVVSVCIFPYREGMRDNAAAFIERIRSTYETLKLGSFEPLSSASGVSEGLLPYFFDQETSSPGLTLARASAALGENMMSLVQALAASQTTEKNFVVYYVYSPDNPSSIVDSCSAFWDIFQHYKKAMVDRKKSILNDLVLQLVPIDFIASEISVQVLTPQESMKLCLETYDRCTLFGGAMPAPAIVLEQPLPKSVDFKVTTAPSPNLLHENSCIHIAYALSVDSRWISVAWTDNRGSKQMTASYCVARRGKPQTTQFGDVASEIWDTTNDLISMYKVHWRVIVTKCGPMDQQEADIWISLSQTEQSKASVSLMLMTVDTNPSMQLIPPSVRIPLTTPSVFYTTPVSTPQPSIVSPDQSGNPPTPMGGGSVNPTTPGGGDGGAGTLEQQQLDGDTTLVDVTDTTWGVVASHRLNNSTSLTELNTALASGYLIKRCGVRAEDGLTAMEINIIYTEGSPRVYEPLLREMLVYFRGLGTLARARGVVDKDTDVRPWHVAAAEKAARVLHQLM